MNSLSAAAPDQRRIKRAISPEARMAASVVSRARNIAQASLFSRSRCAVDTARARQLAMYLTHVIMRQSLTAVGMAFGRDRTTVSYACALIEDMRDDPRFDAEVCKLETLLERPDVHA